MTIERSSSGLDPGLPPQRPGLGEVETRFFRLADGESLDLLSGQQLRSAVVAYEQYGQMSPARDNVILLFHALTGSQHAAGFNVAVDGVGPLWTEDVYVGWWDDFIGPGRALDTDRYCVVCANYLGGCYGTTGPLSIDSETGRAYGPHFPRVSFSDSVRAQIRLLDHLGVEQLKATVGVSTGGLASLALATLYPERVETVVLIASGLEVTPLQRIHNLEQIRAIEHDGDFVGGNYLSPGPVHGMALARMISHKTFISLSAMESRARAAIRDPSRPHSWYELNHPLESYMEHQGQKFARRFDANSYLRILDAWSRFDLIGEAGVARADELFRGCGHQTYLIFSIDSDVCFYPEEQEQLVEVLGRAGLDPMRIILHSAKGHDSFLTEPELYTPHLAYVLG